MWMVVPQLHGLYGTYRLVHYLLLCDKVHIIAAILERRYVITLQLWIRDATFIWRIYSFMYWIIRWSRPKRPMRDKLVEVSCLKVYYAQSERMISGDYRVPAQSCSSLSATDTHLVFLFSFGIESGWQVLFPYNDRNVQWTAMWTIVQR